MYNENGDWDVIYFTTTAGSVLENNERRFLNPNVHKINDISFFDLDGDAQSITIDVKNIKGFDDKILNKAELLDKYPDVDNLTLYTFLSELIDKTGTSDLEEDLESGGDASEDYEGNVPEEGEKDFIYVKSISLPSDNKYYHGVVDLAKEFEAYVPIESDTTVEINADFKFINGKQIESSKATIDELVVKKLVTPADFEMIEVEATQLKVQDRLITVAKDNTETLTYPAGIVVPNYDGINSGSLYFDSKGIAWVGDVELNSEGNINLSSSNTTAKPLVTFEDNQLVSGLYNKNYYLPILKYDSGLKTTSVNYSNFKFPTTEINSSTDIYNLTNNTNDKDYEIILPSKSILTKTANNLAFAESTNDGFKSLQLKNGYDVAINSYDVSQAILWKAVESGDTLKNILENEKKNELLSSYNAAELVSKNSNQVFYQKNTPDANTLKLRKGDIWIVPSSTTVE